MRIAFALISCCLLAAPVSAKDVDVQGLCNEIGFLAQDIMKARQAGATFSEMLAVKARTPDLQRLSEKVVMMAFRQPRYETAEMRQKIITEFASSVTLMCSEAKLDERLD